MSEPPVGVAATRLAAVEAELETLGRMQAAAWKTPGQPGLLPLTEKLHSLRQHETSVRLTADVERTMALRLAAVEGEVAQLRQAMLEMRAEVKTGLTELQRDMKALRGGEATSVPPHPPLPPSSAPSSFYCDPFLRDPDFLPAERDAPLMVQNCGLLERDGPAVLERMAGWPALLEAEGLTAAALPDATPDLGVEVDRIIEKDVERTFLTPRYREPLQIVLRALAHEFKAYAQAMSYVTGLLMLANPPHIAAAIVRVLNSNPKYIPGYWTTEAVAFATDAYVFFGLLRERDPDLATHLQSSGVVPEVYLQKWFSVLCIQNLPFELGVPFLEHFLRGGVRWLFQFGLALHAHFREALLATKEAGSLLSILRLEPKAIAATPLHADLFGTALLTDLSALDLPTLRTAAYETHLKARMDRARAMALEAAEASDSEPDGSDAD